MTEPDLQTREKLVSEHNISELSVGDVANKLILALWDFWRRELGGSGRG